MYKARDVSDNGVQLLRSRNLFGDGFPAVHFHEAAASVRKKRPRGSRERAPVYVQCEPKENDEVAHRQLLRNFAISFEARMA